MYRDTTNFAGGEKVDEGRATRGYSTELDEVGRTLLAAAQAKREDPGRCVLTAISSTCRGVLDSKCEAAFQHFIRVHGFAGSFGVYSWHDAPERTAEQVIAALESAALIRVETP